MRLSKPAAALVVLVAQWRLAGAAEGPLRASGPSALTAASAVGAAAFTAPPEDPIARNAAAAAEKMRYGDALFRLEDLRGACKAYRETIDLLPSWWMPRLALVRCGRLEGAPLDELLEHAEFAVKARPELPLTHLQYGLLLEEAGKDRQATVEYLKALAEHPRLFDAHYRLGVVYERQGDVASARRHFETALDLQPGHVVARSRLAELAERDGDLAAARTHLELLVSRSRFRMQALARLIQFLERYGVTSEANTRRAEYERLYR